MVGADRFDEGAGERGAPDAGVGTLASAAAPDDSYWSSIDYPEPRPRPVEHRETAGGGRSAPRGLLAGFLVALLIVGAGAYALGRMNGHSPVPGLHRQLDAQRSQLHSRAATIAAQARTLASDEAELRSLRAQVSQSAATQAACRDAIADANRAFGTESDALHALAASDFAGADALTNRLGSELDDYAAARSTCEGTTTSV